MKRLWTTFRYTFRACAARSWAGAWGWPSMA